MLKRLTLLKPILSTVAVVKSCSDWLILLLVKVCIEEVYSTYIEMDSTFGKVKKNSLCAILRCLLCKKIQRKFSAH